MSNLIPVGSNIQDVWIRSFYIKDRLVSECIYLMIKVNDKWFVFQIDDWKFEYFETYDEPKLTLLDSIVDDFKYPTGPWKLYDRYVPRKSRKFNGLKVIKRGEADVGYKIILEDNYIITLLSNDDVQEAIQVGQEYSIE